MSEKRTEQAPKNGAPTRRPAWKSPALFVAIVVTLIGVGMWAYAATTKSERSAAATGTGGAELPDGMVSGFSASGGEGTVGAAAAPAEPRLIDRASPAVARFGGCFIAGFCVAYAFKKAIKVAAIITGVVLIGMFAMSRAGIIDFDWSMMEGPLNRSVAWIGGEAGAMKDFILGYLPSAGSATAGMFVGFRRG